MIKRVARFIEENGLLRQGDKVIVALSGGADSVALLHVLISFMEELELTLYAAHFHHGIRGEEADRDLLFVQELCTRWRIPLYTEKADVPAEAAKRGESVELCGRNLRYQFLERVACEQHGVKIATAHHRDDNAETVLWNLVRGSGIGGLGGIPVQRENIIRPLLCVSRTEIEAYCRENGLEYVTDSTNRSDAYTRNKLRHLVVPVLHELNPNVGEMIANTSVIMREADDHFCKISEKELKKAETAYGYSCDRLLKAEPIIVRYTLKKLLENAGAPVDFHHIALIIEAMRSGGAVNMGKGYTVSCVQGILRVITDDLSSEDICIPLTEYMRTHGSCVTLRDGLIVSAEPAIDASPEKIHNLLLHDGIPCDIIKCNTVVRCRREGDTFTDQRRGVTKTLKKLMNELKIPRELRGTIPVIADGSTILWLEGYGTSVQGKADLSRDGEYYLINGGKNHA